MDSFVLYCPICRRDTAQIAPGVHQCGYCMYGPCTHGHHEYTCLSDVEFLADRINALCFTFGGKKRGYIVSSLSWPIGPDGKCPPGMRLTERLLGVEADPANFPNLPLPVVVLGMEKWELPPNTPCLVTRMVSDPLGEKIRALTLGQSGKSGVRPFLTAQVAHSPTE